MVKRKAKKSASKKSTVRWSRQAVYKNKSLAQSAANSMKGKKGYGAFKYTVKTRVTKVRTGYLLEVLWV